MCSHVGLGGTLEGGSFVWRANAMAPALFLLLAFVKSVGFAPVAENELIKAA